MAESSQEHDLHFSAWFWRLYNFFRRLFNNPKEYCSFVEKGQVVADLGSGPGYYTLALAEAVGSEGKVYAVDSDEKAISKLKKKACKQGSNNVETYAGSAHDLSFIEDKSVDFVLANGLLCCMASKYHEAAIKEMKRILKPSGKAYLAGFGSVLGNLDSAGWERVLEGFKVERRGKDWAVVSKL